MVRIGTPEQLPYMSRPCAFVVVDKGRCVGPSSLIAEDTIRFRRSHDLTIRDVGLAPQGQRLARIVTATNPA